VSAPEAFMGRVMPAVKKDYRKIGADIAQVYLGFYETMRRGFPEQEGSDFSHADILQIFDAMWKNTAFFLESNE